MRCLLALLLLAACVEDPTDPATVEPDGPPSQLEPPDCSVYAFAGEEWDCTQLDRCDTSTDNLAFNDACCDCDPRFCQPDPACSPPDG